MPLLGTPSFRTSSSNIINGAPAMERWLRKAVSLMEDIHRTAAHITALRNEQMREIGLDRRRWAVLLAISSSNYSLSISDLARALKKSRQATHRMAVALARAGWVEFLLNGDDHRIRQLALTSRGKSIIAQIRHSFATSVIVFSAHLDARALHATSQLLHS